jgi:hypothetical protein
MLPQVVAVALQRVPALEQGTGSLGWRTNCIVVG